MTNYYKILGLPTYASITEVKEAYKTKIKQYHPDISSEPNAEEMTKYLNLAKGNLDTPAAKAAYDQKLKLAYLREIQRLTNKSTPPKTNKIDLQERVRRSKEARKWRVKRRYEKSLRYLPKKIRKIGVVLLMIWGLQLIYSHYFFYFGSLDRILVILGIGIFFTGASFAASEAYTHYIIASIRQRVPHRFEQKIGFYFIAGVMLGLVLVSGLNEFRAYYHLKHNYAYTLATIDYEASLNQRTVVRYEVANQVYYKQLDVDIRSLLRLNNSRTAIKYALVNPLICTAVDATEAHLLPREL